MNGKIRYEHVQPLWWWMHYVHDDQPSKVEALQAIKAGKTGLFCTYNASRTGYRHKDYAMIHLFRALRLFRLPVHWWQLKSPALTHFDTPWAAYLRKLQDRYRCRNDWFCDGLGIRYGLVTIKNESMYGAELQMPARLYEPFRERAYKELSSLVSKKKFTNADHMLQVAYLTAAELEVANVIKARFRRTPKLERIS